MRALVLLLVPVLLVLLQAPARACGNAVRFEEQSVATLREAERALDEGDVATARELAEEVLRADVEPLPYNRALHLKALSFVRDSSASPESIERAVTFLRVRRNNDLERTPSLEADYGETLERAGHDDEALASLRPLADRDVMGSAYAYAALSRAAERRGEPVLAASAGATCRQIAAHPDVCSGKYPPPPLLRGKALGYALPGCVFLAAALMLRRRRRNPRPWTAFYARAFTAVIALAAIGSFVSARSIWLAGAIALASVLVVPVFQLRAFLAHVRRGHSESFRVRPVEAVDASAPGLPLFFGPSPPETLERVANPSYRESARSPVVRIVRRSGSPRAWILTAITIALGLLLVGGAAMTFVARSSSPHRFSPEE